MNEWSLPQLLASLHDDIQKRLETVRKSFDYSETKGDASKKVGRDIFQTHRPRRNQGLWSGSITWRRSASISMSSYQRSVQE